MIFSRKSSCSANLDQRLISVNSMPDPGVSFITSLKLLHFKYSRSSFHTLKLNQTIVGLVFIWIRKFKCFVVFTRRAFGVTLRWYQLQKGTKKYCKNCSIDREIDHLYLDRTLILKYNRKIIVMIVPKYI